MIPIAVEEKTTDTPWNEVVARLSRLSVTRHFDAYADVDWDSDELHLDPEDPRWEITDGLEPLGQTEWYRSLPQATRARLGCEMVAARMKIGLEFESVLKRGLLEFAAGLPNGAPEFRYAYHEVIEEAQHSLMFQEFVNRSGFNAKGLQRTERWGARQVVKLGRKFPALFFIFVLGGEDPIDHYQRKVLREVPDGGLHPLVERIMRIHITEEARHLSFARHYLKRTVPGLGRVRRAILSIGTPLILGGMAQMMLRPSPQLVRRYGIPKQIVRDAYLKNKDHQRATAESLGKVRDLSEELGLRRAPYRWIWRAFKLES